MVLFADVNSSIEVSNKSTTRSNISCDNHTCDLEMLACCYSFS
jgi:hypothetical protein